MPLEQSNSGVKDWARVSDLAEVWQVSEKTIYRMLVTGELEGTRVRRTWRVSLASIQKYIRTHTRRAAGPAGA
ncbi:MAG: helix-turn-helix domain-containing protein [Planctomycetota bacterium]